jgi:soluble P-type ATPase
MIELNIPGRGLIQLEHLVSDVNGTLAVDGDLLERIIPLFKDLRERLDIHLVTANTHHRQNVLDQQLGVKAICLTPGNETQQKAAYVASLGASSVVAIGQGANDTEMLREAAIGIALLSPEGLAVSALMAADLVVPDIYTALELLEKPLRLVATLRK